MNLTVTSAGRQFDRLALMYLGDIEVFRTSTAEPTADGIVWTYVKDMTQYNSLWRTPQKIIFDLGNLIDNTYTASFNTTLTATFFTELNAPTTADLILPISAELGSSDQPSAFQVPSQMASTIQTIPPSTSRAVVSISACGQIAEEFWYTNVLSSDTNTFANTTGALYGFSPFREIQLLIDGFLAGVIWPFPIIFTGGIVPGFWRPIVGIDAFDLREPEIDITPFVPILRNGNPHTFDILVRGLDDNSDGTATLSETVGSYWIVTGKIFLYLGGNGTNLTRTNTTSMARWPPKINAPAPTFTVTSAIRQNATTGANESLSYTVNAERVLSISSYFATWTQSLSYFNVGLLTSEGLTQSNTQSTTGSSSLSGGRGNATSNTHMTFSYPITVNTTYDTFSNGSGFSIAASLNRGLDLTAEEGPYFSVYSLSSGSSDLATTQFGGAFYVSITGSNSSSSGNMTQDFREVSDGTQYQRHVRAVNGSVVEDAMSNNVQADVFAAGDGAATPRVGVSLGRDSVRALLGRGPGESAGLESPFAE